MLEINKELENKVLANVPENEEDIKRVLRIYYQLCNTLEYSTYFTAYDMLCEYYMNPENLIEIDGTERGICNEEWLKNAGIFEPNGFLGKDREHKTLCVQFANGYVIQFDPINSIHTENAFLNAKGKFKISGVNCIEGDQ